MRKSGSIFVMFVALFVLGVSTAFVVTGVVHSVEHTRAEPSLPTVTATITFPVLPSRQGGSGGWGEGSHEMGQVTINVNVSKTPTHAKATKATSPAKMKKAPQQVPTPKVVSPLQVQGNGTVTTPKATQTIKDASDGSCVQTFDLGIWHPSIDFCAPFRGLVTGSDTGLKTIVNGVLDQVNSFLWTTPTIPFTSNDSGLLDMWNMSWSIVIAMLAGVVAWAGFRYMIGGVFSSWLSYASLSELIPRILFGLMAAYFSKDIFSILFQASNALSSVFHDDTLRTMINGQPNDFLSVIFQIIYVIMAVLLIIEEVARMAILYLLFAFSPILFFLAALREAQGIAKGSFSGAILVTLLQPCQEAVLDVGGRVLSSVLQGHSAQFGLLNFLVGITILAITLMLFMSFMRIAAGGLFAPLGMAATGLAFGAAALGGRQLLQRGHRKNDSMSIEMTTASGASSGAGAVASVGGRGGGQAGSFGGAASTATSTITLGGRGSRGRMQWSSSSSSTSAAFAGVNNNGGSPGGYPGHGGGFGKTPPASPPARHATPMPTWSSGSRPVTVVPSAPPALPQPIPRLPPATFPKSSTLPSIP